MVLVNLHGVATAQGDVGAAFAAQGVKVACAADLAVSSRSPGGDFAAIAAPEIVGEEGAAHLSGLSGEKFEGFRDSDGGGEVDCRTEDARGVASVEVSLGRRWKDAGETGCWAGVLTPGFASAAARKDVHGGGVSAYGGGVDPWGSVADTEVVEQIAGFEVVGAVEYEGGPFK